MKRFKDTRNNVVVTVDDETAKSLAANRMYEQLNGSAKDAPKTPEKPLVAKSATPRKTAAKKTTTRARKTAAKKETSDSTKND